MPLRRTMPVSQRSLIPRYYCRVKATSRRTSTREISANPNESVSLLTVADFDPPNREVEQRLFATRLDDDAPVPYRSSLASALLACRELKTTQNKRRARSGRDIRRPCAADWIDRSF